MSGDLIDALQLWFLAHCDGDWEHDHGVTVDTLDNPGWSLKIDLGGTELEGTSVVRTKMERDQNDWLEWWVAESTFHAACGPRNLAEAVTTFFAFAHEHGSDFATSPESQ